MFRSNFPDFERHTDPFGRHSRMFKKGDMKYVILELLKDSPSHGYEITLALEERFHGLYTPSAGSIYPILQLLEDTGYVTLKETEGKKVYTITASGEKFLDDHKETREKIEDRLRNWWGTEDLEYLQDVREAMNYAHELKHFVGHLVNHRDHAKIAKVNNIMARTFKKLEELYKDV
jgi:DNA-binding PadR family transcriptional regulator